MAGGTGVMLGAAVFFVSVGKPLSGFCAKVYGR